MKIAFISAPTHDGVCHPAWRGLQLAQAIQKTRHATAVTVDALAVFQPGCLAQIDCAGADILVLQASPHPAVLAAIQHFKTMDKTVVLDLGPDCLVSDGKTGANRPPGQRPPNGQSGPAVYEMVQWSLRLADAVMVSSQRMLEDVRGLTRGVLVPDFIDLDRYLNLGLLSHEGIVLGWKNNSNDPAGILSSGLQTALERICQVRPEVRVAIIGGDESIPKRFSIPPRQISHHLLNHPDDWPALLSQVDVGLAPLSGVVDERRGWEDVLEFMSMKIPWVASHGPVYYELRPYGWIIENNASTWERVLLDVIDHLPAYYEEACGDPYLFAISQGIDENVERVLAEFIDLQGISQVQRRQHEIG